MNKEEFIDFLESYLVFLNMNSTSRWNRSGFTDDFFRISYDYDIEDRYYPLNDFHISVNYNNENATINVVANDTDGKRILLDVIQMIVVKFDITKYKGASFIYGGYEFSIKKDFETIRDILVFCVSEINARI